MKLTKKFHIVLGLGMREPYLQITICLNGMAPVLFSWTRVGKFSVEMEEVWCPGDHCGQSSDRTDCFTAI
jgi:hypothetical protein